MKKIFAFVLSLTLALSFCSVLAFAESKIVNPNGSASHDVTATYQPGTSGDTVYSVDITWGDMAFTYTDASTGTWNPETHSYDGAKDASWKATNEDGNKIVVTNHSNTEVTATFSYESSTGFEGITATFDTSVLNLRTAVGTSVSDAPSATTFLTISGELESTTAANTKIGTVKITLG